MTPQTGSPPIWKNITLLTLLVPASSFGGIALAVFLGNLGYISNPGEAAYGCIIGAFILGYLAYIMPRRDIVSLLAPLYAVIIFVIPLEVRPNLLLQILFAASITILVIRLRWRFSKPLAGQGGEHIMDAYFDDYIEKIRPLYKGLDAAAGHQITQVFFSFKFGLYDNAEEEARKASAMLPGEPQYLLLKKALTLLGERSGRLARSDFREVTEYLFDQEERMQLPIHPPPENIDDAASLDIDNALLLLYSIGVITSPDDEEALDEHRRSIVQILMSYKKAMNL